MGLFKDPVGAGVVDTVDDCVSLATENVAGSVGEFVSGGDTVVVPVEQGVALEVEVVETDEEEVERMAKVGLISEVVERVGEGDTMGLTIPVPVNVAQGEEEGVMEFVCDPDIAGEEEELGDPVKVFSPLREGEDEAEAEGDTVRVSW